MKFKKILLPITLLTVVSGCTTLERHLMKDVGNRLSEPYASPQILVDIKTETQTLDEQSLVLSLRRHTHAWDVNTLVAAELKVPSTLSKRTVKRLRNQLLTGPQQADYRVTVGANESVQLVTHHVVAKLTGCEDLAARPAIRDGKDGYSPALECASLSHLVASIADPRDLLEGKSLSHSDSINATSAVYNYYTGSVIAPKLPGLTTGGGQ